MMPPDAYDDEFVGLAAKAAAHLMLAVELGGQREVVGALNQLLAS
jgi:hypothetical protein